MTALRRKYSRYECDIASANAFENANCSWLNNRLEVLSGHDGEVVDRIGRDVP